MTGEPKGAGGNTLVASGSLVCRAASCAVRATRETVHFLSHVFREDFVNADAILSARTGKLGGLRKIVCFSAFFRVEIVRVRKPTEKQL